MPKIDLDALEKKDHFANIVKAEPEQVMEGFDYGILQALVTDFARNFNGKHSMNGINSPQRMRVACTEKGQAEWIIKVKSAEGDAQCKDIPDRGVADLRRAVVVSPRHFVDEFQRSVSATTAKDEMNVVLMTQHFDTREKTGALSRTNAILIPHPALERLSCSCGSGGTWGFPARARPIKLSTTWFMDCRGERLAIGSQ